MDTGLSWVIRGNVALLVLLLIPFLSEGAEFFRKQTGTATIANGSTSVTASIAGVDLSQSFLVFSSTIDNNSPTNFQIGGEITNGTTLTFERTGNTGTVTIKWQVFEFEGGVYVQHGSTTNVTRGAAMNVAINCVDLTKSFVLISARKSGGQYGADDGITANLTTSTNMQLQISDAGPGGADMEEAYWQVIEYQGAVVKKFVTTLNAGSATTTTTITPNITDLGKAMVISNHRFNGDVNSDDLPRSELTNVSTVTYTRVGTATDMTFVTYVIEFTDQTTVVRNTQNFALGSTSENVSITAAASSGVIAPGNFGRQGSTSFATDDNPGHNWFTFEITSPTNLQIVRAVGTGSTAVAPWQVVTFEDQDIQQNTFYSRATGAWETNTSWSFTPDGSSGAVPIGVYPRRRNNVVIQSGHSITVNNVNDNGPCSSSPDGLGRSNVGSFTGSNDQMFYHTGDILIANGGTLISTEEMMLEGYTLVENGGTFTISEDIVNLGFLEVATTATFSNADDLILSGNSTTIINSLSFGADDIYLDWTNATLCGDGIMNLGNGGPDPTVQFFNGGTLAQICSTFDLTCTSNCGAFPINGTGNFSSGIIGPGGIGNSNDNVLWLRANSGTSTTTNGSPITAWNDQSGNTNNAAQAVAAQQPLFQSSVINGQPTILFDNAGAGNNDELIIPDNDNLDNTNGLTILSVSRPLNLNGSARAIVSKRVGFNDSQSYSMFFLTGNNLNIDIDQGNDRFVSNTAFINSTNYVSSLLYDGTLAAGSRARLFVNGGLDITANETSASIPNYASDLTIGSLNVGDGRAFGGHIAEVIIYRRALNEAERIITNNYLSAKYNIAITANDVYTMDDAGNGNYDFDVAGIGQASDGSNKRDARGSGIVRMWNPNNLANGEFLMWGHDNTSITSSTTTSPADVDGTIIQERLSRIWRIGETGDVGTVSISFDFSGLGGSPQGSNLRLLIDRDGDGFGDNDVTPIVGTVSNGIAVFSGVNFQNGDRFTLGNTDASMPLPVELISFTGKAFDKSVRLEWITASELNNDFFDIERSENGMTYSSIAEVTGKGTTEIQSEYSYFDERPINGLTYYRLKQVDLDGTYEYSPVIAINFDGSDDNFRIWPNPSNGGVVKLSETSSVKVFDSFGRLVMEKEAVLEINAKELPAGVYIIKNHKGQQTRLIVISTN